jgi:hypothetical protein
MRDRRDSEAQMTRATAATNSWPMLMAEWDRLQSELAALPADASGEPRRDAIAAELTALQSQIGGEVEQARTRRTPPVDSIKLAIHRIDG